jgi:hypothetical protein
VDLGNLNETPVSLRAAAAELGISEQRVEALEKAALERLALGRELKAPRAV